IADDTSFLLDPDVTQMSMVRAIQLMFNAIAGLRCNLKKTTITPIGDVQNMDTLARVFGCVQGKVPSTCLGMPLGCTYKNKSAWDPIVDIVNRRLDCWKIEHLSKVGN
ncbi:Alpha-galactosidase, partial [Thalictrum thalictroides]